MNDDELKRLLKGVSVPKSDMYGRGFLRDALRPNVKLTENQRELAREMIRRNGKGKGK